MPLGQAIELGPFNLTVLRMLIAFGFVRVIARGERLMGGLNSLDWLMVAWAAWALISSFFHAEIAEVLVNRLGLVYNGCGIYFLLRVICQSLDDTVKLCRMAAILLIPVSIEMLFERITGNNLFSALGARKLETGRFVLKVPSHTRFSRERSVQHPSRCSSVYGSIIEKQQLLESLGVAQWFLLPHPAGQS
jgi:hypothetical protein